ncbi:MAG: ATP-dependent DNA ligase [Candidatus Heimdallarchaeaceae archaeon]
MQQKELPILYGMSRLSKVLQWQAKVEEHHNGMASIIIEAGYVGGKIQIKPKIIKKGKNIGKSNETTPFEQALSEIESKWTAKRFENYEPHMLDPDNYIPRLMLPQLAKGVGKGKIVYPAYIQPKLNGVCNLAEIPEIGIILHHSRGGHLFETLAHLDKWLIKLNAPAPTHGELYFHGWSLQRIGSYTKKIKPDQWRLEYWLYDMANLNMLFDDRINWLEENIYKLHSLGNSPIRFTPTSIVNNYEEAKAYQAKCVQDGYEGAMLKNAKGVYMFQYNSNDLEKVKDYQDSEFEIIGGKEGTGTDDGCIIYRCITESGKEFDARPRGTVEDRKQMLIDLPNSIGKLLTVRYAELSDDGVPLQPVGIPAEAEAVRDYE